MLCVWAQPRERAANNQLSQLSPETLSMAAAAAFAYTPPHLLVQTASAIEILIYYLLVLKSCFSSLAFPAGPLRTTRRLIHSIELWPLPAPCSFTHTARVSSRLRCIGLSMRAYACHLPRGSDCVICSMLFIARSRSASISDKSLE